MKLSSVNYLSALAAAVAAFAFGAFWYHDAIWGTVMMEAMNMPPDSADEMTSKLAVEFAKLCVMSVAVSWLAAGLQLKTPGDAFTLSVVTGIAIVGATIVSQHDWGDVPPVVTAIDVGYSYITVLIFSLFGCLWGKT